MEIMLGEFNKGLGKETNPTAKVKMFPTYVRDVPDGTGKPCPPKALWEKSWQHGKNHYSVWFSSLSLIMCAFLYRTFRCIVVFVSFPENGNFLALDLGGTNFRVLLINLNGQEVTMESKIYLIPQHIMTGTGEHVSYSSSLETCERSS